MTPPARGGGSTGLRDIPATSRAVKVLETIASAGAEEGGQPRGDEPCK